MTSPDLSAIPLPPMPAGVHRQEFFDGSERDLFDEYQLQDYARLAVAEAKTRWLIEQVLAKPPDTRTDEERAHGAANFICGIPDNAAVAEATASWRKAEHDLSDAYLRLRKLIPGAFDTPPSPTVQQVWEHTERCLQKMAGATKVPALPSDEELDALVDQTRHLPIDPTPWRQPSYSQKRHEQLCSAIQRLRARVAELEQQLTARA